MKVSRSCYYEWLKNPESNRTKRDKELTEMISIIFHEGRRICGSRRIKKQLEKKNIITSRRRIIRLIRKEGLEYIYQSVSSKQPLIPNITSRYLRIYFGASSMSQPLIVTGWGISRMFRQKKAGYTLPLLLTSIPEKLLVGLWQTT